MSIALVFPGQGSQFVGMGQALAGYFAEAREVFEEVDEALQQKIFKLMVDGSESDLQLTENAQPAIMAVSMAVFRVVEKQMGIRLGGRIEAVAGHSLGEYSALCAAEMFDLATTAKLLKIRGLAMQQAVPVGVGAMAAILGLDLEMIAKLCEPYHDSNNLCAIANDNAPGQVVISGHESAVLEVIEAAKTAGAKRAIRLQVSAPFHCALVQSAAVTMREALALVSCQAPWVVNIANVTACAEKNVTVLKDLLVQQVTSRVRWRESVQCLKKMGVEKVIEMGPGAVLAGLCRRIEPDIQVVSVHTPEDMDKLDQFLSQV